MESQKKVMRNIVPLLRNREIGKNIDKRSHQFTKRLITNLMPEGELKEWNPVSSLNWNYNGRYTFLTTRVFLFGIRTNFLCSLLAVASTYGFLCIWEPFIRNSVPIRLPTPQPALSITSVRFVGDSHASVATASKNGLTVQNWRSTVKTPVLRCNCHHGGAAKIDTAPAEPYLIWSAGNRGLVL